MDYGNYSYICDTNYYRLMANVQFRIKDSKTLSNLYVRFYHNKIDTGTSSDIFILNDYWSKKTHKIKSNAPQEVKDSVGSLMKNLEERIFYQFSVDFPKGCKIDNAWLKNVISTFHSKPTDEDDIRYYFVPFIESFIESSKTKLNPKTRKLLDTKTIRAYATTCNRIKEFEEVENIKLRISDINLSFHRDFTSYLKLDLLYSNSTINKFISQIKLFIRSAKSNGYETSPEVESDEFSFRRDDAIDTYLSIPEIDKLYNLQLENESLSNVRDLFIVGAWTGLRISDLKRINEFDITNNKILIAETEKTDSMAVIPIHPQVKSIFEKHKGVIPIMTEQHFNRNIKRVCELAEINEPTIGNIKNPETNRHEKGIYPKFKLISSHTCRRSFVTNHYNKIDDKTLMSITTHKSHSQFLEYVKTTHNESVEIMQNHWNKQNT